MGDSGILFTYRDKAKRKGAKKTSSQLEKGNPEISGPRFCVHLGKPQDKCNKDRPYANKLQSEGAWAPFRCIVLREGQQQAARW